MENVVSPILCRIVFKCLHIGDIKATTKFAQGGYFVSQKPLFTVKGKDHNLLFVKLRIMLPSKETVLMTAKSVRML